MASHFVPFREVVLSLSISSVAKVSISDFEKCPCREVIFAASSQMGWFHCISIMGSDISLL